METLSNEELYDVNAGGIGMAAIGVVVGFGMGCLGEIVVSAVKGETPSGGDIFKAGAQKAVTSGISGALLGPF